jgi:hypothetical protein
MEKDLFYFRGGSKFTELVPGGKWGRAFSIAVKGRL